MRRQNILKVENGIFLKSSLSKIYLQHGGHIRRENGDGRVDDIVDDLRQGEHVVGFDVLLTKHRVHSVVEDVQRYVQL